jgi:hypothetical protein
MFHARNVFRGNDRGLTGFVASDDPFQSDSAVTNPNIKSAGPPRSTCDHGQYRTPNLFVVTGVDLQVACKAGDCWQEVCTCDHPDDFVAAHDRKTLDVAGFP